MSQQINLSLVLISMLFFLCMSCNRDEVQAENSVQGIWEIVSMTSYYGSFSEITFSPEDEVKESGQLGEFNFGEDSVEFSFTRNDTLYSGNESSLLIEMGLKKR